MKPARARFGYFVGMADKVGGEERPGQGNNQPPQPEAGKAEKPTEAKPPEEKPTEAKPAIPTEAEAPVQSRLDGLRGWLAALDRRVSLRTQVGIVLLALAIGFGAAALYVAIDARENGASEARVESLREALQALNVRTARTARQVRELQASAGSAAGGAGATLESLQAQVTQLNAQVQALSATSSGSTDDGAAGPKKGASTGTPTPPGSSSGGESGATQGTATR